MAEHDHDPERQLDLLGGFGSPDATPARRPEPLAVRWAEVDAPGKVGCAAWPGSGIGVHEDLAHVRDHHRASIVLAVADDPTALLGDARELGLDVRHLAKGAPASRLEAQAAALAADLRAGRRVVVVADDASLAALPACCALVMLGRSAGDAVRAVGALSEREKQELDAFVASRAKVSDAVGESVGDVVGGAPRAYEEPAAESVIARVAEENASSAGPDGDDDASKLERLEVSDEGEDAELDRAELGGLPDDVADDDAADDDVADDDVADDDVADDDVADDDVADDDVADRVADDVADDGVADDGEPGGLLAEELDRRDRDEDAARRIDLDAVICSPRLSRLAGAVLGGAIGDAMGHPTEFIRSFDAIRERYGPHGVTGYELWREREGVRFAPYTDDTQMAECVLRSLLWAREHDADLDAAMRDMAARFVAWANEPQGGHRAPGNACLAGCRNLERGVRWQEAGGATAGGCGSVMRAYPFGLIFARDLERAERWAVAHSKLTHRDPIALAASAAMAVGVARVMRDEPLELVLSEMVAAACRYSPKTAAMMARAIDEAQSGVGPETTLERLEGWAAHEAIAAAVYLFARHPDDPRAAILEGANTPGDSDSLATLAGALVGARAGIAAFPRDWVRDVERASELLELAVAIAGG